MKNHSSKPDPAKVSHTIAVMCAKSLSEDCYVPYGKEIWQRLREYDEEVVREGNTFFNNFIRKVMMSFPGTSGLKAILEGRYVAVNNALEAEGNPHVMELASGFSPRGLDFTRKDANQIYIETDLAGLQQIKREIVEGIRQNEVLEGLTATPNYHLIPLNCVNRKEFMRAAKPYADSARDKPLAIVHGGLFPYLDREEQKMTRDNIAEVLRTYSPDGMWVTPDIVLKGNVKTFMTNPIMWWRRKKIGKKTGRKLSFFEDENEAKEFLAEGGFKTEVIHSAYLADSLSCVKNLGLNPDKVRQKASSYDIYKMKLSNA